MKPGTVVVVNFVGVNQTKRRPAVVVSTESYNLERPDHIVALITSQTGKSTSSSDHVLQDWRSAGLKLPSAVRMFIQTYPATQCRKIGELSDFDWDKVKGLLNLSISF